MGRRGSKEHLGHDAAGSRDAIRRRGRRRGPRYTADRSADDDLHFQPGPAVNDSQHVQDCGRATSTVFHIAARSVATHALSIFGDHSDVMATRSTGWGMLFSNSIQEVMDFALIAQAATLGSRVPFLDAFDGFRTSHEVMKLEELSSQPSLPIVAST